MPSKKTVRKAVFPVAGLGTRFLPATKALPKEMLTVVDRPVIQYVVDEAREAGIEHFVFVTGRNKGVIEDHFDLQVELNDTLAKRGKTDEIKQLANLQPKPGQASFTRQQAPLGLGHAVWCARDIIGDEPFALLLPDMIMQSTKSCLSSMVDLYEQTGGNIVAVEECDPADAHKYGIVDPGKAIGDGFHIKSMIEKPEQGCAPSNLIINGRYILQPEIFSLLENQTTGAGGEIQLTDAMLRLAETSDFFGFKYEGRTFDCGSTEGFIASNVAFSLWRPDMSENVRRDIEKLLAEVKPFERRSKERRRTGDTHKE
jgi:UTP--glucose-1-phosphate uridylyltransferase